MTAEDGHRRLESGAAFIPGVSEKRLEKAARREKDHTAKFRILACLARKRGRSIRWISRDLKTPYSTVRDWLLRMRDRGLGSRFNLMPKGRGAKITLQMLRTVRKWLKMSPKKCGFETKSWQMGMVIETVRREFGVAVKTRTLRRWLRRIRFSWRKGRYVPYRSASKKEQEEFKEVVGERAALSRSDDRAVFAEDEAAVQRFQNPTYGWRPTGGRDTARTRFSNGSAKAFCALGEGAARTMLAGRTDSKGNSSVS